jgi:hypothetical protein
MKMRSKNPMPTVEFEGRVWSLKSRKTEVPDIEHMDRFDALIWLNRNTIPRGYHKAPNPLTGMGGAISLV